MKNTTPKAFWDWFIENVHHINNITEVCSEEFGEWYHRVNAQLKKYIGASTANIMGRNNDGTAFLTVSAAGIEEKFERVEQLVNSAPYIEGWVFNAFIPPCRPGKSLVETFGNFGFDPYDCWFEPPTEWESYEKLHLFIYIKMPQRPPSAMYFAMQALIENVLGEWAAAHYIDEVFVIGNIEDLSIKEREKLANLVHLPSWIERFQLSNYVVNVQGQIEESKEAGQ